MFKWWRKRQRQIDLDILWPSCKEAAREWFDPVKYDEDYILNKARFKFTLHCFNDTSWKDYTVDEIVAITDKLT